MSLLARVLILGLVLGISTVHAESGLYPFQNSKLTLETRVQDLVSRLTLDEKIEQMNDSAPEIARLGIPAYEWHTEGAHGAWAWGGLPTTVYPQVIGLAASWNPTLLHEVAVAASDEMRAVYAHDLERNPTGKGNNGLSIFAPNINIFRDPRWGRGQETYGEDPYLTSRLSVEYIKGLQGDDAQYLKVAATAKHFAVYSGPEGLMYKININPSEKDLWETYLPAFETAVKEGQVSSVMCAYGSVNGAPSCANDRFLNQILRKDWGFKGAVVSDCGAVRYVWSDHHYTKGAVSGVAASIHGGNDLSCQGFNKTLGRKDFSFLKEAVAKKLVSEKEINQSVARLFSQRFQLGMFDPKNAVGPAKITDAIRDSEENRRLARHSAQESMVLLKNKNNFLPLAKNLKKISVIGPNATDHLVDENKNPINILLGTYHGSPSRWITPLAGIKNKVSAQTKVFYHDGKGNASQWLKSVKGSDVAILVLGLQPIDDDKAGDFASGEGEGRDRTRIELPADQKEMLKSVKSTGVPMVVVLINGSAVASVYAENNADAILEAWYPGEEGGTAIADVLFGDYNPSGRLPITVYRSTEDLPPFDQYSMQGRTYRYFKGKPLYSFGDGLSYSQYQYSNLHFKNALISTRQNLELSAEITNSGSATEPARSGDEVVQVYVSGPIGSKNQPIRSLKAFRRLHFEKGEKKSVEFQLDSSQLSIVSDSGKRSVVPGTYSISIGGHQPDSTLIHKKPDQVLVGTFQITK